MKTEFRSALNPFRSGSLHYTPIVVSLITSQNSTSIQNSCSHFSLMNFYFPAKLVVFATLMLLLMGHFPASSQPYVTGNIYLYLFISIYALYYCTY